jgi:hypothetical protein
LRDKNQTEASMPTKMFVDDNAHYKDSDYRSGPKIFADLDSALSEARRMVDDFLAEANEPGMTGRELFERYTFFGPDPWFVPEEDGGPTVIFSAWDSARSRCNLIAAAEVNE